MEKDSTERKGIRNQHYFFVQSFLYDYIHRHPFASLEFFNGLFLQHSMEESLKGIWDFTYSAIQESDPNVERIEIEKLPYTVSVIDEFRTIVVITLPDPLSMTESYYVGIYYQLIDKRTDPEIRYFTLEYHNIRKSALCELSECKHTLWGFTKNLSVDEFIEDIKSIVID
ncbi:MAG: hypothetical protein EPN82_09680 [Bacteroidetes bacterium]|nr:MAG: hypothetical protein EPN82_09680 [Bacteroidota bacterium]